MKPTEATVSTILSAVKEMAATVDKSHGHSPQTKQLAIMIDALTDVLKQQEARIKQLEERLMNEGVR